MSIDPDDPGRKPSSKSTRISWDSVKILPSHMATVKGSEATEKHPYVSVVVAANAEHQNAYWPQHKAICKDAQKRKQVQDEFGAPEEFALAEHRRHLVEDWVTIHRYTISQAMAWAFQDSAAPVNFRSQYFEFRVKFRPEGEDNLSTSFFLDSAAVRPIRGSPAAPAITVGLPKLERLDVEQRAAGTRGFLGVFSCLYLVDNVPFWTSAMDIYADGIPPQRPADTLVLLYSILQSPWSRIQACRPPVQ
ncbi:hypothetical protein DFH08DRAFT_1084252 [Mycena albidolilacea]|uniref:Uncharacterized protein n=1 Tax=Mycena albidolilacea TaxID=1033008 RepID=A0AAD7EKX1_9AGAR|nr:hypothetical protein DFH08DRAFT_1084252 [Mycena albidolilacea]